MLNEINRDYYKSCRKSILDYVLKDPDQLKRLGIEFNPEPPVDYGSQPFKGIEPNEEWQTNVMMARMLMSDNLCICSPATLGLKQLWGVYEEMLLIDLPEKYESIYIDDYIERQESRMTQVQNMLNTEWTLSAVSIISEEIKNMDREQAATFFEATSALMSNQLRQLVTDSIGAYLNFFKKFDIQNLPKPSEMVENIPQQWPESFLRIKLTAQDGKIVFSDNAESILAELITIVSKIAEKSEKIPRPDHGIAPNEKNPNLWFVSSEDDIVLNASKQVKHIIRKNLDVALEALKLYEKYTNLLTDKKYIEQFIHENHSRNEYRELIERYETIEREIRRECPVRIRLNMIEVECSDINKQLCKDCDDIVYTLSKAILTKNADRATSIYKEFQTISEFYSTKADTEEKLVEHESYKDKCREQIIPNLFNEYNDTKE